MSEAVKLQVLICTCGDDGLQRVADMQLPAESGVAYLVSCQAQPQILPERLQRSDVAVHFTPTRGLSCNRNHAMSLATAPYVLLADDDLRYVPGVLQAVIKAMDDHPEIDIATFMIDIAPAKVYPKAEHDIFVPYKNYNISSVEIAMRTDSYRRASLHFDEDMGAGTEYMPCGEEDMLLIEAKERGLRGRFFPILICSHPQQSTGSRMATDPGVLRAQGYVISRKYGISRYPRLLLKAHRSPGNTLRNLYYLIAGAVGGPRHKKC